MNKAKQQLLDEIKQSKYAKGFLFNHSFCHNCKQLTQPNGAAFFETLPAMVTHAENAHNQSEYKSELADTMIRCHNPKLVLAYQPSLIHKSLLSDNTQTNE